MRVAPVLALASLTLATITGCSHSTPPLSEVLNQQAAISSSVPVAALDWKVISSSIDRPHGTMSTLTGNDLAVQSARTANPSYPAGAVLALITWAQRDDPHWFGARIPAHPQSIETVTMTSGPNGKPTPTYALYAGTSMAKLPSTDPAATTTRETYILSQRASVMP